MPRMRTIKGVIEYFKQVDAGSEITEHFIRQLVWQNKIKFVKAGSKYLIDIDQLEEYLRNPSPDVESVVEYGKLRRVNG